MFWDVWIHPLKVVLYFAVGTTALDLIWILPGVVEMKFLCEFVSFPSWAMHEPP